ncbi:MULTISPECIES: hypothetical protein [Aeromonas]|uniref:hypothetical protein n=1 Tax=Aeromonas TaxID=642 RepID=UPI0011B0CE13|nr:MULTISPECIES: hypothetical protein [Aeromonas]MCR3910155.1 hypothetical protein [Aeromonas hydrophila]QWL71905.1 hypothetical protein HQ397_18525 [Aeromonas hydrophila]
MEVIVNNDFLAVFNSCYNQEHNDEIFSTIIKMFNEILNKIHSSNGAPIYMFGMGRGGYSLITSGIFNGLLSGIIDNDARKWGKEINGILILPPDILIEHPESIVFVISEWSHEIELQLSKIGVSNTINIMALYSAYKKALENMPV